MSKISNRSLFFYTGLIFVVAIIMVIIAFFGQTNLQKNQPIHTDAVSTYSITEKAAQLSEDNRLLMEQNQKLTDEKAALEEKNSELTADVKSQAAEIDNHNLLLDVYNALYKGNKTKAKEILATISVDQLTDAQKTFYNILVKKSK